MKKSRLEKTAFVYFLIALFCALFGAVYEVFSHDVYSFFMRYAFGFPLVGGTLPFWLLARKKNATYPGTVARNLYYSGIATLTVGSIVRGGWIFTERPMCCPDIILTWAGFLP